MAAQLTKTQLRRFKKAESLLPEGFEYNLHDEADAPEYYAEKIWGVSLIYHGDVVGWVSRDMVADTSVEPEDRKVVKLLLNRVAAALWHEQPNW